MKQVQPLGQIVREKPARLKGVEVLRYRRFDRNLPALHRDNVRNAGYDLFARLSEPVIIYPGCAVKIPLNVATEIPTLAVGLLFQRSSTFRKWGVRLTNSVGVIDALYCGDGDEWEAEFQNMTTVPVTISNGDKVCQAVFIPCIPLILEETDHLGNEDRGGFGTSFDNAEAVKDGAN